MNQTAEITPVVEMRNIKKHFGAVQALRGVDLALHHNEVLGLVGDNAAGKSTLMKVLSGAYIPDGGEIMIEGRQALLPILWMRVARESRWFIRIMPLPTISMWLANVFMGREVVSIQTGSDWGDGLPPYGARDNQSAEPPQD